MQTLPRPQLAERLFALGYLTSAAPGTHELAAAVRAFQDDRGLRPDGWVGPQTRRALLDPLAHFCGVVERQAEGEPLCRWPQPQIAWAVAGRLPHLSDAAMKDAFCQAWGYWAAVCGIQPRYTANARTAHVLMGAGGLDRAGGVLAISELPCGPVRQVQQKYDAQETWVVAEHPNRYEIDLVRVAAHEIGHALGIPHLPAGALMAGAYQPAIRRPQPDDIREAVRRYGPPAGFPHPTPYDLP